MNPRPQATFVECDTPVGTNWLQETWDPVIVPKTQIEAEARRLSGLDRANGRRRSLIVHPRATEPGLGFSPGIQVSLQVLNPGETSQPLRHSSSMLTFCIGGRGVVTVGDRNIAFAQFDTIYLPGFTPYSFSNSGDEVVRLLCYSNAALLEKMGVHLVESEGPIGQPPALDPPTDEPPVLPGVTRSISIGAGARLVTYEDLIDPPLVPQRPLHWPWERVSAELDRLSHIGQEYTGRRLFLLYNPATGRMNGTSPSLIATITIRPPGITDRPHRHAAAAMNYFFRGSGWSRVAGRRYEWSEGDLMFTAPAWAIHNHASGPDPVYEITVQDFPLHMAIDSLLWQEDLKLQPRLLGSQGSFTTNHASLRSDP